MAEPGFQALAVLGGGARAGARRKAHDHGHGDGTAEHVAHLRRLIDDLLHGKGREVGELKFVNRLQPGHRGPDCDADTAQFGNRRVHDALIAEAVDQIARDLKRTAIDTNVLAHEHDPLVLGHGDVERLANGFCIGELAAADGRFEHIGGHAASSSGIGRA